MIPEDGKKHKKILVLKNDRSYSISYTDEVIQKLADCTKIKLCRRNLMAIMIMGYIIIIMFAVHFFP